MGTGPSASWEEIVDRVSIKSNHYNIQEAADGWRDIFRCLGDLQESLRTLQRNSESWKGAAADGFRDRLDSYVNDVDSLQQDHERIVPGLEACADHLRLAVGSIPIPSWMLTKLEDAQQAYQMGEDIPGYSPGEFGHTYLKDVMGDVYSNIWLAGPAWKKIEAWLVDNEKVAKQAYAQLQSQYGSETGVIPEGQPVKGALTDSLPSLDPTGAGLGVGGGAGTGGMPDLNPSLGSAGLNPGSNAGFDPTALEATDPNQEPWEFDPPPGTELAGAGGGLVAAGGGAGGLGGLGSLGPGGASAGGFAAPGGAGGGLSRPGGSGGLGAGAGGAGAGDLRGGGRGAVPMGGMGAGGGVGGARPGGTRKGRLPSLGKGVTPPSSTAGNQKGTGATATRGPVAAPPARTEVTDDEQDPESWLQEDKDPWGAHEGGAPPVLGA